ncbi:MAG: BMP family ABC transporter substrate-binding protein [Blautia sp.]|nr:BMP family ABC transporter substrate-binding protein [Blautia sp.]
MVEDYTKAHKKAEKEYRSDVGSGRYPYLPALDDILGETPVQGQISLGIQEIPLSMIVGTKTTGRQNAFSSGFMPLLGEKSEFAMKWSNLFKAQMEEGLRDPILVYEFMNRYYVQEGNKRVSVMKYVGSYSITADVTRVLPEKNQNPENETYYEYVDFYEVTKLNEIVFSEKGRYEKLARLVGQDLVTPWPIEVVEVVRSAFLAFTDAYEGKGNLYGITSGDAFLIYLQIFSLDSLLSESKSTVQNRLAKIWKELMTQSNNNSIELLEAPQNPPQESVAKTIKKIFTSTVRYTEKKPLLVAFLYERMEEDSRWAYGHELGRIELEDAFFGLVKTMKFAGCDSDEKVSEALEKACAEGCTLIFTTSASMMTSALRAAIEHPNVHILNCSVNLSQNAVRTYYSRMYEAKFLMGALAASLSETGLIGYVADMPAYGLIANINAFAIGAALVRPDAKILLKWSTQKGVDWRNELTWDESISVISGPDFIRPDEDAREFGLYQKTQAGLVRLAAPIWQWGKYDELIVKTVMDGSFEAQPPRSDQAMNYWYGMSAGVIDVILSEKLSHNSKRLVGILRRLLISGDLNPFEGELHSQDGEIKVQAGEKLSSEEIIRMDWLSDNVIGEIPQMDQLYDSTKNTLKVSGVKEA